MPNIGINRKIKQWNQLISADKSTYLFPTAETQTLTGEIDEISDVCLFSVVTGNFGNDCLKKEKQLKKGETVFWSSLGTADAPLKLCGSKLLI